MYMLETGGRARDREGTVCGGWGSGSGGLLQPVEGLGKVSVVLLLWLEMVLVPFFVEVLAGV